MNSSSSPAFESSPLHAAGTGPGAALSAAVDAYRESENLGVLLDAVRALAATATVDDLARAAAPYRDMHEVMIPVYEHITRERPDDAQALVTLANAYWLTGRGADVVGALASRAIAADEGNRAGWHLWALSESNVRARMARWRQVADRFPSDLLARAALADNAVSVAGAEGDPEALALAIETYEGLLAESAQPVQKAALESTLATLRRWRL